VVAFTDAPATATLVEPGYRRRVTQVLRGDPAVAVALAFILVLVIAAAFGPLVEPYNPAVQPDIQAGALQPPSRAHLFGTDPFGRDVLSRVIDGARVSLSVAALAVVLASLLGTCYGVIAGYAGGLTDTLLMRLVDAMLAIPRIILLLAVVESWGTIGVPHLVILLGCTGWFGVSRLVRAEVLAVKQREFIGAARALGASSARIVARHVVPHVLSPVFVAATLGIGNIVVVEAGLSYLGLGIPQPRASWGNIIRDGRDVMASAWWVSVFPGLALSATVLAVNVVAERLRRALNPRQLPAP
jgi:peptide/nickel transport system permease protein